MDMWAMRAVIPGARMRARWLILRGEHGPVVVGRQPGWPAQHASRITGVPTRQSQAATGDDALRAIQRPQPARVLDLADGREFVGVVRAPHHDAVCILRSEHETAIRACGHVAGIAFHDRLARLLTSL